VSDAQALELALIENIQRADLNPLEEAAGYQRLMDEFRYTQEKLASIVGKSRSHVANLLRLLELPNAIKKFVDQGHLSMGHARAERELMQSGEMRGGSNFGRGQMVASDYALSPEIVFSADNAGGIGGVLGGLIGGGSGRAVAAIGGGLQTREASAMLTLVDNRSGVQVAASEGSASKTDLNLFGGLFGGRAGAGLGGQFGLVADGGGRAVEAVWQAKRVRGALQCEQLVAQGPVVGQFGLEVFLLRV